MKRSLSPVGTKADAPPLIEEDDEYVPYEENVTEMHIPRAQQQQECTVSEDEEDDEDELEEQTLNVDQLDDESQISNESLLETRSMRQRYRLAHKLPLPSHYRNLYNLFCSLDSYINMLKHRKRGVWQVTHTELSKMIEHSIFRNFKLSHFQQILTVCPNFFIHKWELRQGKAELLIEIPENVKRTLEDLPESEDEEIQETPYGDTLDETIQLRRREQFSEELCAICYEYFKQ